MGAQEKEHRLLREGPGCALPKKPTPAMKGEGRSEIRRVKLQFPLPCQRFS